MLEDTNSSTTKGKENTDPSPWHSRAPRASTKHLHLQPRVEFQHRGDLELSVKTSQSFAGKQREGNVGSLCCNPAQHPCPSPPSPELRPWEMLIQGFSVLDKWSCASCSVSSRILFKRLPICLTESTVGYKTGKSVFGYVATRFFPLFSLRHRSRVCENSRCERPMSIKEMEESAALLE